MNSRSKRNPIYLSVLLTAGLLSPFVFADEEPDLDLTMTVLEEGQQPDAVMNEISLPEIQPSAELKNLNRDMKKHLSANGKTVDGMENPHQRAEDMVSKNRDQILNTPDVANSHIPVMVLEKAKLRDEFLTQLHDLINQMSNDKNMDESKVKDLVKQWHDQINELKENQGKGKNK